MSAATPVCCSNWGLRNMKTLLALAFLALSFFSAPAHAQTPFKICVPLPGNASIGGAPSCQDVTSTFGFPSVSNGDTPDGQGNVTGGNPVKQGCIFNTTLPTYTNGQIAAVQCNNKGTPLVSLFSGSGNLPVAYLTDNADGVAVTGSLIRLPVISRSTIWNGTNWDRMPGSAASGQVVSPVPAGNVQTGGSSGNIANAAASASIAATATRFSFIQGFDVSFGGATAGQCVTATLTGVIGGTRSYTVCSPTGATVQGVPLTKTFSPPLSSSAVNTQITLSVPALGAGNTNTTVNVDGFN